MAQPKIFVSHSHVDDAFAERLVADLRAAGADAWLDKEQLGAGDFQERIDIALANCEWFLLVLTRNALASPWVQQEVRAANRLKHQGRIRNLLFIQAGPIKQNELPAMWGVYNILDATVDYAIARDRTLNAIGLSVSISRNLSENPLVSPHPGSGVLAEGAAAARPGSDLMTSVVAAVAEDVTPKASTGVAIASKALPAGTSRRKLIVAETIIASISIAGLLTTLGIIAFALVNHINNTFLFALGFGGFIVAIAGVFAGAFTLVLLDK